MAMTPSSARSRRELSSGCWTQRASIGASERWTSRAVPATQRPERPRAERWWSSDDRSFDAVVGKFVMHQLGDPDRAVVERSRPRPWWPARAHGVGRPQPGAVRRCVPRRGGRSEGAPAEGSSFRPGLLRFSDEQELARLPSGHELEAIEVSTISFTHRVSSAQELWHGLLDGTVRTSAIVRAQAVGMQQRIRAAFDRLLDDYRAGSGFELPVCVKLACACRAPAAQQHARRPQHGAAT